MNKKFTDEKYKERLKQKGKNVINTEPYISVNHDTKHKCSVCNHEFINKPSRILKLKGGGCPRCSGKARYTTESFKDKLKEVHPQVNVISEYNGYTLPIECVCYVCLNVWESSPRRILNSKHGCPECAKEHKGPASEWGDNRKPNRKRGQYSKEELKGPVRNGKYSRAILEKAISNGIPISAFRRRVSRLGWSEERSATEPIMYSDGHKTEEAKANGIATHVYHARIRLGWSHEEASTIPTGRPGIKIKR